MSEHASQPLAVVKVNWTAQGWREERQMGGGAGGAGRQGVEGDGDGVQQRASCLGRVRGEVGLVRHKMARSNRRTPTLPTRGSASLISRLQPKTAALGLLCKCLAVRGAGALPPRRAPDVSRAASARPGQRPSVCTVAASPSTDHREICPA